MTADRLAALLHEEWDCRVGEDSEPGVPCWECKQSAARLATHGVTVGLDVERLAAALDECDMWIEAWASPKGTFTNLLSSEEAAAAIARAYAATPQPAEEEGR